ncbi:MAG: hypothetical protein ACTH58_04965 [Marinomonas foliarum]|uniref:hypothetical protein n=1 Tax=Marinomonas foliarum TaxID=491950 RepID=UPI003F9E20EB
MGAKIDKIQAEITLNDNGFLDAINRVDKRTNQYRKAANDAKTGNEGLASSFRSVAQGIAVVDGPFGGVASRVSSTASLLNGTTLAVVGFGAAIAAAGVVAAKSIGAGEQMERQLYKQEAVLRATGYAAGWNAEQLDEMARQTAYATLASVNDIREAQNVMMTFKSVQKSVFAEAVELSQDLAVVMGGTAASNAKMLGKALEDPIAGISAMSRAGVSFTQSQKDVIKSMVETGDKAGAQKLILAELQKQVGGTGSGEAKGLSGSIDTLGQNFQTLFENISKTSGAGEGFNAVVKGWAGMIKLASDAAAPDTMDDKLRAAFEKRRIAQIQYNKATEELARSGHVAILKAGLEANQKEAKSQLDAATVRLDNIMAVQKKAESEKLKNYQKGVETRRQLEQQAADGIRKTREAAGAKSLATIDSTMASEEQKLTDGYVKQLGQIQALTLSEEEVKRRGYVNLAALQLDYQLKLEDQYGKDLNALNAKVIAEQVTKDDAARRDQERLDRQKERSMAYFESIDDQYNQAFLSAADNEDLRFQKTQERMAKERQALIDQNAWTEEEQARYRETEKNAEEVHKNNIKDIKEKEEKSKQDIRRDGANALAQLANSENKTLAAIGKAAAIYQIGIATAKGAMDAYAAMALIPIVGPALGVVAAGAVVAYGAEQITNVKNQTYHTGGIAGEASDNYGAKLKSGEINATLMRGEEVLTADDPRHRNNLGTVYESGSLASSSSSSTSNVTNQISIYIDGGQFNDEEALSVAVGQQVSQQLSQWANSSSFKSAAVGAVSTYAKRNSGRIPGVRT